MSGTQQGGVWGFCLAGIFLGIANRTHVIKTVIPKAQNKVDP